MIKISSGHCRELVFPQFFVFAHKRLVNHNIETLQVNDFDMCRLRCYQEPNCVSINLNFSRDNEGLQNCELNNATHQRHDKELKDKADYFYRAALNACDKAQCKNGGTCLSGFTDKGYCCVCPLGFTSAHCEQDIDECSTGEHTCSHVAVCNNTIGSYNCTCKAGYVGDGRNCSSSGCPKDWAVHDKYCYNLTSDRFPTLEEARRKCKEMLADLPIIKSEQENTFISSLMSDQKKYWIRLGMRRNNSQLLWFDGISAERSNKARYHAWGSGEPRGQDCAYVSLVQHWNDHICDYKFGQAPYVLCQKARL
ncbi:versican core protein-like isoform X2 [Montipora capricornis]|uniref:versican core protein-like isoform X2 n=2 Tax=Montipora capricornis TaxID=246305 RepID=UPI0035F1959A